MRPLGELKIRNQFVYTSNPHATKHPPGLFAKLLCSCNTHSNHAYVPYTPAFQQLNPVTLPIFPPSTTTLPLPIPTTTSSLPHPKRALHSTPLSSFSTSSPARSFPDSTPVISMAWTCSGRVLRLRDTSMGICIDHAFPDVDVNVESCGLCADPIV